MKVVVVVVLVLTLWRVLAALALVYSPSVAQPQGKSACCYVQPYPRRRGWICFSSIFHWLLSVFETSVLVITILLIETLIVSGYKCSYGGSHSCSRSCCQSDSFLELAAGRSKLLMNLERTLWVAAEFLDL
ncbi:unnamed protein product [Fraxinus pennsylvanica]|uniref:Secreted protein n=1 Tax=Fraxinus pennsylvanica TaxID=56036 RepID=A0AAD1ZMN5_9LAMI|nr:unnamed protein product [Fraxinus pennsylvanica]